MNSWKQNRKLELDNTYAYDMQGHAGSRLAGRVRVYPFLRPQGFYHFQILLR